MKRSLIALAIVSSSVLAQTVEPWSINATPSAGISPTKAAIYDPSKGSLPLDRRYMMTREGAEAAKYEAMYPQAAVVAQTAPAPHPYALPAQPPRVVVTAPAWFTKLPEDTPDMMFAVGTGTSTDEQMAVEKARMAAERRLVEVAYSRVNTQTKSYRSDQGDVSIENFEITTRKNASGDLIGAQRVDSQITHDGRVYKVYVLLRLPLGQANTMKRDYDQAKFAREAELRAGKAHEELDSKVKSDAQEKIEAEKRIVATPPGSTAPVTTVPTANGEVKLMQVDNEEYKKRREEALSKPNAVIGNATLR